MKTLIDLISQPWLGSFLGILGLGAAVFFYFRSRKVLKLAFQSDQVTLLGSADAAFPEELEIRFSGVPVPRVTAERVVMWNAGNTTLGGQQIVSADPLRVELEEDSEILKADILRASREVNAIRLVPRQGVKRIIDIDFDYLDPGDGLSFEILHSGGRGDLDLRGTIRGIPSGPSNYGRAPSFFARSLSRLPFSFMYRRIFLAVLILAGLGFMLFGLLYPNLVVWFPSLAEQSKPQDPTNPFWPMVLIGAVYTALPAWILWIRRKRYPASLDIDDPIKKASGNAITEP